MNRQTLLFVCAWLLFFGTTSCSRQQSSPVDPLADSQWYGLFTYAGETISRVFTIQFSSYNDFVWQDMSGSYSGKWSRVDNDVTITFTINRIQTSFRLLGTNQLTTPKNLNHATWTIKQLSRIENKTAAQMGTTLPRTKWTGSLELSFDEDRDNTLIFRPATTYHTGRGTYTLSGPVVQITDAHWDASQHILFFGVFISDKSLIGNFQRKPFPETTFTPLTSEEFTRK